MRISRKKQTVFTQKSISKPPNTSKYSLINPTESMVPQGAKPRVQATTIAKRLLRLITGRAAAPVHLAAHVKDVTN